MLAAGHKWQTDEMPDGECYIYTDDRGRDFPMVESLFGANAFAAGMSSAAALIAAHMDELNDRACMDCLCFLFAEDAVTDGDWLKGSNHD